MTSTSLKKIVIENKTDETDETLKDLEFISLTNIIECNNNDIVSENIKDRFVITSKTSTKYPLKIYDISSTEEQPKTQSIIIPSYYTSSPNIVSTQISTYQYINLLSPDIIAKYNIKNLVKYNEYVIAISDYHVYLFYNNIIYYIETIEKDKNNNICTYTNVFSNVDTNPTTQCAYVLRSDKTLLRVDVEKVKKDEIDSYELLLTDEELSFKYDAILANDKDNNLIYTNVYTKNDVLINANILYIHKTREKQEKELLNNPNITDFTSIYFINDLMFVLCKYNNVDTIIYTNDISKCINSKNVDSENVDSKNVNFDFANIYLDNDTLKPGQPLSFVPVKDNDVLTIVYSTINEDKDINHLKHNKYIVNNKYEKVICNTKVNDKEEIKEIVSDNKDDKKLTIMSTTYDYFSSKKTKTKLYDSIYGQIEWIKTCCDNVVNNVVKYADVVNDEIETITDEDNTLEVNGLKFKYIKRLKITSTEYTINNNDKLSPNTIIVSTDSNFNIKISSYDKDINEFKNLQSLILKLESNNKCFRVNNENISTYYFDTTNIPTNTSTNTSTI